MPNGLLLINLGTPDEPTTPAVRRYLREFLGDPRVLDISAIGRAALLHLVILPRRPKQSAHAYRAIWDPERGSPLLYHSQDLAAAVQATFGEVPIIGPFEFAILAGIGMGWARRARWRTAAWEAFGLPFLAVGAGALCWLLAPEVRIALAEGSLLEALSAAEAGDLPPGSAVAPEAVRLPNALEVLVDEGMRWEDAALDQLTS